MKPRIEIHFCPGCRWWLRAGWMAQELFATYGDAIGEIALVPADSGTYAIRVGGTEIWNRTTDDGFPDAKVLKQRLKPHIAPEHDLGHAEEKG